MFKKISKSARILFAAALLTAGIAGSSGATYAQGLPDTQVGTVYTQTNSAAGNSILAFRRAANGVLTPEGRYATGGLGSGMGLGSQNAVILSENGKWLFAVNAGSSEISVMAADRDGLTLVDMAASGGRTPISLTYSDGLLYVLNAGSTAAGIAANITGFRVGNDGTLTHIEGSTRPLSAANPGPAQVQFSPDGHLLVVTEKATGRLDTYTVGEDGTASGPLVSASSGGTPFGFAFNRQGTLIVSEAAASTVSSYRAEAGGALHVVSASVPTHQAAACWIAVTKNGRYAYSANAASGTISGFSIGKDGSITLLNANGVTGITGAGSTPLDMSFSVNSRYLYTLNSGAHSFSIFGVGADGSLSEAGTLTGLPVGVVGLAAR